MRKVFLSIAAAIAAVPLLTAVLSGCSKSDSPEETIGGIIPEPTGEDGLLFVINEGNFTRSNSSLSVYN
ncbi:MAG: hypothetical protein K2L00_09650, partial [Muribaculaceae bacterium]|nr:hypothetical protein [Muribaculaceae bacterium]